jgi:RNA polymerase sigma factor (sigma-70 family)
MTMHARDPHREALEASFLEALPRIEQIARCAARRHRLPIHEVEDFVSDVKLAFIRDDYAVLDRFKGKSKLSTFVVTVVERLCLDYMRHRWGKWRPCAAARRHGPVGERLDELVNRDGLSFSEALETLRLRFGIEGQDAALQELAQQFPVRRRGPARPLEPECGDAPLTTEGSDASVELEDNETAGHCQAAVTSTVMKLGPTDRVILRIRFEEGVSVADIARGLHLDPRKLYRRIDLLLEKFRSELERHGVHWAEVERMIRRGRCHLRLPPESVVENAAVGPSRNKGAA